MKIERERKCVRERKKKEKEEGLIIKEKRKEKKMELVIGSTHNSQKIIVCEGKSIWISFQKHDKVVKRVPSRIPIPIKSFIFVKNMLS